MPTPDERMVAALDDFEAAIAAGTPVDLALEQTAREHRFSAEALKLRATRRFGDLTTLKARLDEQAETLVRNHRADTAIEAYLTQSPESPFFEWFEERVGRLPTDAEESEYTKRRRAMLISRIKASDVKITI